jgi:hypothetical protein
MNISADEVKNVSILCDRLQCLLKCLSVNKLNIIEEMILLSLAKELAYNINIITKSLSSE